MAQGITPQKSEPFVRLRLRDSPESRALWNFPFELDFTVTLGVKQLGLRLSVCNKGSTNMEFCTSLRTHLGVSDLEAEEVKLLVRITCHGCDAVNAVIHVFARDVCRGCRVSDTSTICSRATQSTSDGHRHW